MKITLIHQLISFVRREFGLSRAEVMTALHHSESVSQFPVLLWQYGFITVKQLEEVFAWLENASLRFSDI